MKWNQNVPPFHSFAVGFSLRVAAYLDIEPASILSLGAHARVEGERLGVACLGLGAVLASVAVLFVFALVVRLLVLPALCLASCQAQTPESESVAMRMSDANRGSAKSNLSFFDVHV